MGGKVYHSGLRGKCVGALPWLGRNHAASNNPNSANLPANSSKAMLEERQKSIKKDVEKLYDLAAQLKTEVEKTDSTTILSLAMLKKAEEIEKLARQIKDHARG